MDVLEIKKGSEPYCSGYEKIPSEEQLRAKKLCWEYNRTAPTGMTR